MAIQPVASHPVPPGAQRVALFNCSHCSRSHSTTTLRLELEVFDQNGGIHRDRPVARSARSFCRSTLPRSHTRRSARSESKNSRFPSLYTSLGFGPGLLSPIRSLIRHACGPFVKTAPFESHYSWQTFKYVRNSSLSSCTSPYRQRFHQPIFKRDRILMKHGDGLGSQPMSHRIHRRASPPPIRLGPGRFLAVRPIRRNLLLRSHEKSPDEPAPAAHPYFAPISVETSI